MNSIPSTPAAISQQLALAIGHQQAGRWPFAEQLCRQILEVDPNQAEALNLLGLMAHQFGKYEAAARFLARAIAIQPNVASFHCNLGGAHHASGRISDAVACYRRALQLKPDLATALNNLGKALNDLGQHLEAAACCRRAVELEPDDAVSHNNLGNALYGQDDLHAASQCYRRALELMPHYAVAHNNLGNLLQELGQLDEAVACYSRALELRPDFADAHYNFGSHFYQIGDFESSQRSWRIALKQDPRHPRALASLAMLLGARLPADELAALLRLAASTEISQLSRAALHFAVAHIFDAQGDYAGAAQHSEVANAQSAAARTARGQAYDPDSHERFVAGVREAFSAAWFGGLRGSGVSSQRPVFIFGLPRTGTTLLEQLLAGHSQVFGAGELPLARLTFGSLPQVTRQIGAPLDCVAALDRQTLDAMARRYLEQLTNLDGAALCVVDKMPENYVYLGLLAAMFPQAKFIHCRRDLRDVALSCWMTDFRQVEWSNDVHHIAARFRAYQRLMDHWRSVLPVPILNVDYETTVADVEETARQVIAWCGLDWEPECLRFHTRRDPVRTASAVQVRQPIYQHAVGRWKHYADLLAPLLHGATQTDCDTQRPD